MSWFREHRALVVILALQALLSLAFVYLRVVDADEGFYLAAAQRVADGLTPHVDFFYPQGPLFPTMFSVLSGWGLDSLVVLRLLAALCGMILTYIIYRFVLASANDKGAAAVAAFLVALGGLSLTWHSVFKPYALTDLLIVAGFALTFADRSTDKGALRSAFGAMFFLAFAANLRSVLLVLLPIATYFIFKSDKSATKSKIRLFAAMALGVLLPSLPTLYLAITAPGEFFFNNLGFHLMREPIEPLSALILHKVVNFGKFLVLPQTILLLGAAAASWFLIRARLAERPSWFGASALFALAIVVCYLAPTPVHMQYFQQAVPFLVLLTIPCAQFILREARLRPILRSAGVLYVVGLVPFVALFIVAPRDENLRFEWRQLNTIVDKIQANSREQDTLLSEWAGYAALSNRPQLAGSEHVGFYFPLELSESEYAAMHLLTNTTINEALAAQRPELVVVDYQVYPEWREVLTANYHPVDSSARTFIYKKNDASL